MMTANDPKRTLGISMTKFCKVLISIIYLLLIGCGSTPYKPFNEGIVGGGYYEVRVPDKYVKYNVTYVGNGTSKMEIALQHWQRRSSELCKDGYEVEYIRAEVAKANASTETAISVDGVLVPVPITTTVASPNVFGTIICK